MSEIPTFPVVFKSNNKGKISRWQVVLVPAEGDPSINVQVTFGEETGAQQTHVTNVSAGKAKRTVLEQAILVARSKWNEKTQRDGYQETLPGSGPRPGPGSVSVRPMLANTFDKSVYEKKPSSRAYTMPFPLLVQRKYDGIRCLCYMTQDGEVVLESRKGVAFQTFEELKEETRTCLFGRHAGLYFDGELFTDQLNFETISGLVRLTKAKAKADDLVKIRQIEFHVYDVYDPRRPDMPFRERMQLLQGMAPSVFGERIQLVPTLVANTLSEVKTLHDQFVQEGFEGIMLRDPVGPYEVDKRSKFLQKYKEFMEEEFRIVGFHDGDGIDAGLVIWECVTASGQTFSARPRGTHAYRRQLFTEAAQHVGKWLTVIFQELSADGTPRFPVGKAVRSD